MSDRPSVYMADPLCGSASRLLPLSYDIVSKPLTRLTVNHKAQHISRLIRLVSADLSAEPAELDAWLLRSGYRRPLNGPSSEITATVDHCIGRTDLAALPEMCAKFEISAIVLGSPVPPALMRQIAAGCSELGCSLHVETNRSHGQKLPARPGAALRAKTLEVPARLHVSAPHVGLTLSVARRCLDIILSVALIAACLPFLLISALAILADSRGSAFFGQVRIGERGQPFRLWKLRTMLLLKPVTMETIAMTVATPTTIPRIVRPARSLCVRTASSAKRTFSPKPRRRCEKAPDTAGYSYRRASIGSSREALTAG